MGALEEVMSILDPSPNSVARILAPTRRSNYIPPKRSDYQRYVDHAGLHDYGTDGVCRTPGCRTYDRSEDDDRITDVEDF